MTKEERLCLWPGCVRISSLGEAYCREHIEILQNIEETAERMHDEVKHQKSCKCGGPLPEGRNMCEDCAKKMIEYTPPDKKK